MRIEVMIPFYGDKGYLFEAVNSVRNQTVSNWKLTIVDNASPDQSVFSTLSALNDKRIHYTKNPKNIGPTANFNRCVELAQSEYVVIMGHDDRLKPNFLERVYHLVALASDVDAIHAGVIEIDADGQVRASLAQVLKRLLKPRATSPIILNHERLLKSLFLGNWTYSPAIVWRVSSILERPFNVNFQIAPDFELIVDLAAKGRSFLLDTVTSFEYRRHESSFSGDGLKAELRLREEREVFSTLSSHLFSIGAPLRSLVARGAVTATLQHCLSKIKVVHKLFWPW